MLASPPVRFSGFTKAFTSSRPSREVKLVYAIRKLMSAYRVVQFSPYAYFYGRIYSVIHLTLVGHWFLYFVTHVDKPDYGRILSYRCFVLFRPTRNR